MIEFKNVREACEAISKLMRESYIANPEVKELKILQLAASIEMLARIIGQTDLGKHPVRIVKD